MNELIRRGDRGERVTDVQRRLLALGFDVPADERAGVFGDGTYAAVRNFQQTRGLLVDGIVGQDTWRELVEASWRFGERMLYLAAPHLRGDDVRALQDRLNTLGFDAGRVDGIFGPRTLRALREFQRNYGIKPDGIVGQDTVRALAGLPRHVGADTPAVLVREREHLRRRTTVAGLRIVLDPGHGGGDTGHVGATGAREDVLCYTLARQIEATLAAAGANVFLTRREDVGPDDQTRAALANALDADVFLGIHLGGGGSGGGGAAAFYFGHERFHSESGKRLAEMLLEDVCALGLEDDRAHAKTFPVLRETKMTAVVLEPAYLTNAAEEELLLDHAFLSRLATAIAQGVVRWAREPVELEGSATGAR